MSSSHPRHRPTDAASGGKTRRAAQMQEAIEKIVKDIPRGVHLTAPEVYRRAREQGLQVSLSTVYRTLNLLQQHGNVSTVAGEHGKRYEARDSDHDHDHLICLKCGLTIEFTDELIRGFGRSVCERKGYEHASTRFDILGICSTCKAQDEAHKIETAVSALAEAKSRLIAATEKVDVAIGMLEARKLSKAGEVMEDLAAHLIEAQSRAAEASVALSKSDEKDL